MDAGANSPAPRAANVNSQLTRMGKFVQDAGIRVGTQADNPMRPA